MNRFYRFLAVAAVTCLWFSNNSWAAASKGPRAELCSGCHKAEPGRMMGLLENLAEEPRMIQLGLNTRMEVLRFDQDTKLQNVESIWGLGNYLKSGFKVDYIETDGEKLATRLVRLDPRNLANPPATIAKDILKKIITNQLVSLYDARSIEEFARGHIPGALPLTAENFEEFVRNLPADKEAPVVIYDTSGTLSHVVAMQTKNLGYENVRIYAGGYRDWSSTEYLMVAANWLKNAIEENTSPLVIDLRPAEDIINGHISGGVNIPITDLDNNRTRFPPAKETPIIFYGPNSKIAAAKVISWGYSAVGIIPVSFDGWQALGYQVSSGPGQKTLNPVPRAKAGTITLEEFETWAGSADGSHLIIDVRSPEEFNQGRVEGAINIPLPELEQRAQELPRDTDIILYSNRGDRAAMAHNILNMNKLKSHYLDSAINLHVEDLITTGR